MNFEQIKELHEMGFSADQIMSLSGEKAKDPEPVPEEPEAEQTEPAEEQTEEPKKDTALTELENRVSEQQKMIDNLTKQLQAQNRKTARIDSMPDDLQTKTDKIMAELIRPTIKEVK